MKLQGFPAELVDLQELLERRAAQKRQEAEEARAKVWWDGDPQGRMHHGVP